MPPKSQIILAFRLPKFSFHSIWDLGFGIIWDLGFRQLVIWNLGFGIWDFGIWILNLSGRYIARWIAHLSEYEPYSIIRRKGNSHLDADALSRLETNLIDSLLTLL